MDDDDALRITLAIDPTGEPISGWLEGPTGIPRRFVGMLDLISLLERARAQGSGGGCGD